jgi:hypothetical protein
VIMGGIINYTIRIVLVCDGFFHYHFEPPQNMRNSLIVCGFQFSQCPKLMLDVLLQPSNKS